MTLTDELDDVPNVAAPKRRREHKPEHSKHRRQGRKERVRVSLRAIADALARVSARIDKDTQDDYREVKEDLNNAVGRLMELANGHHREPVADLVDITTAG